MYSSFDFSKLFDTYAIHSISVKRLFAIVVLVLFLLNVLGYYGVLVGMKATSGEHLSEMLDNEMYDLGSTVTFQIPLTVPYGTDSKGYERVDGTFEKDGEVYRLVKQQYLKDTLYIVCIKDVKSSSINSALTDFAKTFAEQEDGQQKTTSIQVISKDYVNTEISLATANTGWEVEVNKESAPRYLFDSYYASIVHPPDRA